MTVAQVKTAVGFLWSINQWSQVTAKWRNEQLSLMRVVGEKQSEDRDSKQYLVRTKNGRLVKFSEKYTVDKV